MKKCDLCGNVDIDHLYELTEFSQTHSVKEVCEECIDELNEYYAKIDSLVVSVMLDSRKKIKFRVMDAIKKRRKI